MKRIVLPESRRIIRKIMADVMKVCSPRRSMNIEEIGIRVSALKKINTDADVLLLEDDEHSVLLKAIKEFPYQVASQEILDAVKLVESAESVDEQS